MAQSTQRYQDLQDSQARKATNSSLSQALPMNLWLRHAELERGEGFLWASWGKLEGSILQFLDAWPSGAGSLVGTHGAF